MDVVKNLENLLHKYEGSTEEKEFYAFYREVESLYERCQEEELETFYN